jgi:uncharacterized protein (TIGR02391 family)
MRLVDLIPDPKVLCALEPEELGLQMLPVLAKMGAFLNLERALAIWIGDGRYPGEYPRKGYALIEEAIREAWAWLEGSALLVAAHHSETKADRRLSRGARRLANEPNAKKALSTLRLPKEILHPSIREDVWSLYHRGKYDTAVFEAMKAVEIAVRDASEMPNTLVGVKLMRAAFALAPNTGPLTDMTVDPGEQVARMELFAGAIGSYKNPHSHRNIMLDDPDEAVEIIMLANHLLRIVDAKC